MCWWPAKQNDFLVGYQWDTIQVCRDLIRDKTMNIKDLQEKKGFNAKTRKENMQCRPIAMTIRLLDFVKGKRL